MKHYRKPILFTLLAAACLAVAGCNAVQGLGRDITYAGEKTEEWITGAPAVHDMDR